MKTIYDAVIVGAGPAGAFCGYKLSQIGLNVLILEGGKEIKRKVCGEYLCPSGVKILQEEGFEHFLSQNFLPINGMKIATDYNISLSTHFPRDEQVQNNGLALNRKVFDHFLLTKALEVGATSHFDKKVKSISGTSFGWELETTENETFYGRMVVGADGRNSTIAKLLGFKKKTQTEKVALHCHIQNSKRNNRFGEMHLFEDGSYIGIDPVGERELNISLVCKSQILKQEKNLTRLLNRYVMRSPELRELVGEIGEEIKISTVAPITNRLKKITGRNVALIGDAAGFLDPLTGEGIFNSLWTAKQLAIDIESSLNLSLFSFQKGINRYEKSKRIFFRQKNILNTIFQMIIMRPKIVKLIAYYLKQKEKRGDIFIGMIGNIYKPLQGIVKLISN